VIRSARSRPIRNHSKALRGAHACVTLESEHLPAGGRHVRQPLSRPTIRGKEFHHGSVNQDALPAWVKRIVRSGYFSAFVSRRVSELPDFRVPNSDGPARGMAYVREPSVIHR
jgi:hypothetical protein